LAYAVHREDACRQFEIAPLKNAIAVLEGLFGRREARKAGWRVCKEWVIPQQVCPIKQGYVNVVLMSTDLLLPTAEAAID
jgi:hypothetical protein